MSDQFDAKAFLKTVTSQPGVYRMYDAGGTVIYVGKAKDLKKRLSSYFRSNLASRKTEALVAQIQQIDVTVTTQVQASNRIVRAGDTFYLLTDTGVECLSTDGTSQWTQSLSARSQGLLADRRQLLVFCGNTVQVLTPPAAENNAQSNT